MVWINIVESVKSIAGLKPSHSKTGAKLQTNFEVLDCKKASGLQKIINEDFNRRVFIQEEAAQKKKLFLRREGKSHE